MLRLNEAAEPDIVRTDRLSVQPSLLDRKGTPTSWATVTPHQRPQAPTRSNLDLLTARVTHRAKTSPLVHAISNQNRSGAHQIFSSRGSRALPARSRSTGPLVRNDGAAWDIADLVRVPAGGRLPPLMGSRSRLHGPQPALPMRLRGVVPAASRGLACTNSPPMLAVRALSRDRLGRGVLALDGKHLH